MRGFIHESTHNESKEWYTPKYIFDALGLRFDLDPCSPGSHIVPWIPADVHFTKDDDGLEGEWFGNVFVNPPYGADTPKWLEKLSRYGNGIALVFARTDTKWFQKYVLCACEVCFVRGRVLFVAAHKAKNYVQSGYDITSIGTDRSGSASVLIGYGNRNADALRTSNLGLCFSVERGL
jgi:hypothetical protein